VPVEEQVVAIFAGVRGHLDRVPIGDVTRFEQQLRAEIKAKAPGIVDAIRRERELSKETEANLEAFLAQFTKTFA